MIVTRGLTKRYGKTVAVDDLSFTVSPGVVTGFLGPNGSGKSTTMRMILGLDRPDAGSALVNGSRYAELSWPLREVGALLDAKAFHPGRSARNHLRWLAQTNDIPQSARRHRARHRRAHRGRRPPGRQVLARHGTAARHRQRPARRPGRAALRRAGQRPRPRRHPLGPPPVAGPGRPRAGPCWSRATSSTRWRLTAERLVVIGRGTLIAETSVDDFIVPSPERRRPHRDAHAAAVRRRALAGGCPPLRRGRRLHCRLRPVLRRHRRAGGRSGAHRARAHARNAPRSRTSSWS